MSDGKDTLTAAASAAPAASVAPAGPQVATSDATPTATAAAAAEEVNAVNPDWWAIRFDAERSKRYHRRRASRLSARAMTVTYLTLIASSAAVLGLFTDWSPLIVKWVAAAAALLSMYQVAFRPAELAQRHSVLVERFTDLLADVLQNEDASPETRNAWRQRVAEIEKAEPPCYNLVERDVYVETCRALGVQPSYDMGGDSLTPVRPPNLFQRAIMHWYRADAAPTI